MFLCSTESPVLPEAASRRSCCRGSPPATSASPASRWAKTATRPRDVSDDHQPRVVHGLHGARDRSGWALWERPGTGLRQSTPRPDLFGQRVPTGPRACPVSAGAGYSLPLRCQCQLSLWDPRCSSRRIALTRSRGRIGEPSWKYQVGLRFDRTRILAGAVQGSRIRRDPSGGAIRSSRVAESPLWGMPGTSGSRGRGETHTSGRSWRWRAWPDTGRQEKPKRKRKRYSPSVPHRDSLVVVAQSDGRQRPPSLTRASRISER